MSAEEIEQEIQAKGLNAPRLSPRLIEELIIGEQYISPGEMGSSVIKAKGVQNPQFLQSSLKRTTICTLILQNGFVVVGSSACVSIENFDLELGRKAAREDAVDKVWALEGYAMRSRMNAVASQVPS